ncbi:TadE family protein [Micromonospora sp. NPDC049559]|uniref:TadE/TadG family type IV pilus assembly protein n=1 Tax=Micromonospora sp. NPDC049559 TaxID=3155923 RepID=UPI0034164C0C
MSGGDARGLPPARRGGGADGERDRGASPVELAILLPGILVLLFAAVQVAAIFLARTVALAAAQEAVGTVRVHDGPPDAAGVAAAERFIAGSGDWLTGARVYRSSPVSDGTRVSFTVEGRALSILPWVDFPVRQTAHGTVERFTVE